MHKPINDFWSAKASWTYSLIHLHSLQRQASADQQAGKVDDLTHLTQSTRHFQRFAYRPPHPQTTAPLPMTDQFCKPREELAATELVIAVFSCKLKGSFGAAAVSIFYQSSILLL
jgi:hypothetical protein